jgi:hypothetical protein
MMLSRGEAQSVVEAMLSSRKPTRPMTDAEMSAFCQHMLPKLDFRASKSKDRVAEIRKWALAWEGNRFPEAASDGE